MSNLDVWYAHVEVEALFEHCAATADQQQRAKARANAGQGPNPRQLQAFEKLTQEVDGERRIIADPPLIEPDRGLVADRAENATRSKGELRGLIRSYRRSLETDRRHLLEDFPTSTWPARWSESAASARAAGFCCMLGETTRTRCSCRRRKPKYRCWRYVGESEYDNQRTARRRRAATDAGRQRHLPRLARLTGLDGQLRDFYVRQLRDWKGSADVDTMAASADDDYTRGSARRPWPAPTPAPATASPSRPT